MRRCGLIHLPSPLLQKMFQFIPCPFTRTLHRARGGPAVPWVGGEAAVPEGSAVQPAMKLQGNPTTQQKLCPGAAGRAGKATRAHEEFPGWRNVPGRGHSWNEDPKMGELG